MPSVFIEHYNQFCFCRRELGVFCFFCFFKLSAGYCVCESAGYMVLYASLLNIAQNVHTPFFFPFLLVICAHDKLRETKLTLAEKRHVNPVFFFFFPLLPYNKCRSLKGCFHTWLVLIAKQKPSEIGTMVWFSACKNFRRCVGLNPENTFIHWRSQSQGSINDCDLNK